MEIAQRLEVWKVSFLQEPNKVMLGSHGGHLKAKGTIYLSNIRMVFVANKPVGNVTAFDIPLLYVHGEKFNQPIFFCNNISGQVEPVSNQ
ncbi:hypothetical protein CFP56_016016 [Quercus suber]|uniref:GRAM domain-containing protein n=1 Tax=Quercus suber TaxID=58331 RepID=A0AAW0KN70_QUESU